MNSNITYRNLTKVKSEILLLILLTCSFLAISQSANVSEEDVIKQANELFSNEDYQGALPLYAQLVSVHPAEAEYNYRFGVCTLFGDRHDKKKPIRYLNNASKTMKDNQMLVYYLGLAYHQNEEYATAMRYFNMYLAKLSPNSSERASILEKVNACLNGLNLSHKRLISEVISKSEFQKDNFHRAYRADQLDGSLVIKPEIFQTSKEKKRGDLTFVYISEPREVLYYAGYENEKSSNKDIFKVAMDADGNWGQPEKLGASINTPYDEDYPVVMDNGLTMYFCSKGHSSLGGFDIYRTKLDTVNNIFSQPENLGAGINSPFDDIMFVLNKEQQQAYFASDRDNLDGSINVFNIKLVENPFNEEMLLAQKNNLQEIFAQKQAEANQNKQLAQGQVNSKVAAYKAAHEKKVTATHQTTTQSPSMASQKADNMMADRAKAHNMADSAYLVIAGTKKLIRDLTNKRDRANAISKRKADEAKALESRFDESISMIVKIENENQFKTSLSKAIELKVEVCQLNKRAEIADNIAWNLGRQIKTKNKELEKLKLQAGKIQTASVSGTLEESNMIFTDFRQLVVTADTIVDFTSQIMAITNNEATYEVPKTQLAFAEQLMTAFHNNTLMAEAINVKPVVQENAPIEIVDKRTYKPELANEAASKPVMIKPVELISQISTDGIMLASNEPIENELELNFTIDIPAINIIDLVEPVSIIEYAFTTEPDEADLELNFSIDQVKALDLVTPVDMTYVAFNDITVDDDQLDLSFEIDKKPIHILPIVNQVNVESYAINIDDLETELEINFEIDKRVVNAIGIIQPVFVNAFALNTEPEENDIELNFELDQVEPIELIYPIDLSLIAFNDLTVDEKELEINYAADKSPIEVAPLIAPIYKESLAVNDIEIESELEINYDVDQPEINILKVVEPVYMTGYVFSTEPVELMLDISTSNDQITPIELVSPVNINAIAFNDDVIFEEDLDLNFSVDKPTVKVASIIAPIFYASNTNDIEFFENELELNFTNDKLKVHTIDVVSPVYSNAFAMDVYPDESDIEVNFNSDRIVPATLVNPVNITAIAYNDIVTEEFLELNFEIDEPTINIVPQIHTIEMNQLAVNTEPEEYELELNFTIDKFKPIMLAQQVNMNMVAFNESNLDEEILELNFDIDKLDVNVIPQVAQIYADASYAMNTEIEEADLEINLSIDKPQFSIPQTIHSIAYTDDSDVVIEDELEINFNIDKLGFVIPKSIQTIAYTDMEGIFAFDEELEINFDIDSNIAIPQVVETVEYASNTLAENDEIEDIIQINFDIDKQLNAFMEANNANRQEALFYLRESVMQARNIETSRSDIEILELALTTPDELSYEELLYAASLAFRPEDKLVIYNAAFIHIDRDWRAYNNAAVSAIHVASLGQADCYLYQASLISEDNGSIENNRGILACYKDQFDVAEKHFVNASSMGYDALYNLQVVNNLVIDYEVERIANRNNVDQKKDTQKAVVDVIDYGTSSSDD